MKLNHILAALLLPFTAYGQTADSLQEHSLTEVCVTASPKEHLALRRQPASVTLMDATQLQQHSVQALKGTGSMVPNFFMPDYGSRQTSAIYMRGIGSRIGTPAVGLYVDNVPYYDKATFDFTFYDVESIEVLRGPQSTLYGRNTMGGLVKVNTRSPFLHEGTDLHLGYATGDDHRHASLTHYHHVSPRFAFAAGGFYDGSSGFFRNSQTGRRADDQETGGGRMRLVGKPTDRLTLDASVNYEYSHEGAYPYFYTGAVSGPEQYAASIGRITSNLSASYRRSALNAGLHTEYRMPCASLHSITAFQSVKDRMFMDQDFISDDIYSLEQRQRINTISEELTLKGYRRGNLHGLLGANVFFQWQKINAPVTFRHDGVEWLNSIINGMANAYMPPVVAGPMTMTFLFSDRINGEALPFKDRFSTPTLGTALFHQLSADNLFGLNGLSATLGVRLDYEKQWLTYRTWYDFSHTYSLQGHMASPFMTKDITMVPEAEYQVSNQSLSGHVSNDYLQLLPRLAVKYDFPLGNLYGTVSRGYRSGGYSVQNISELMRSQMQADMMRDVRDATLPVLNAQPAVPAGTKQQIAGILNSMAEAKVGSVAEACRYNPEYAWNYEVGTHLNTSDRKLQFDLSAFLSNVRDLQLSRMSENGLGRIIVNAGRSRSLGTEASLKAEPVRDLKLSASYGYTHATFRRYFVYDASTGSADCRGRFVPFMPRHTVSADAAYTFRLHSKTLRSLTLGMTCSGAGRIYWDEQNSRSQSFYSLLASRLQASFPHVDVMLWGRNLTNKHYNTFWFQSMNRGYEQHGKPVQVGVDVNVRI